MLLGDAFNGTFEGTKRMGRRVLMDYEACLGVPIVATYLRKVLLRLYWQILCVIRPQFHGGQACRKSMTFGCWDISSDVSGFDRSDKESARGMCKEFVDKSSGKSLQRRRNGESEGGSRLRRGYWCDLDALAGWMRPTTRPRKLPACCNQDCQLTAAPTPPSQPTRLLLFRSLSPYSLSPRKPPHPDPSRRPSPSFPTPIPRYHRRKHVAIVSVCLLSFLCHSEPAVSTPLTVLTALCAWAPRLTDHLPDTGLTANFPPIFSFFTRQIAENT
ncbi:uncharacterized protein CIMG_13052 [Coccidioides immitis RS]|uniref:Uncharacterized protein n=1 Tax=Coccidioides immitis (strain RS) TaxID=246410 RepID=A0A0D8JTD4_COCIM|nr:uncharacterized protein CIMG_13052 [Coccidioides immitis RS]KJF60562.1 hypothetical protein CIMG_13052 [Coccidioides immitis RS]